MAHEIPPESGLYYSAPGSLTSIPAALHDWLDDLPHSVPALVEAVQNNLIHVFWGQAYGVEFSDTRKAEVQIRSAAEMLRRIFQTDPAPLTTARPPEKKLVGNCRHFSLLLCTLLRHQGIPARARCGFGAYFMPGLYIDHWVCEYYHAAQGRWIQVDAQLDKVQRDALNIDFDPFDVPRDRFLNGGRAWEMCRQEGVDPDLFGIMDLKGLWFVRGDLIRDFAALNKVELLPWDSWGLILAFDMDIPDDGYRLLDRVAALCQDGAFDEVRALYDTDERLRVPPVFKTFPTGPEPQDMTLADAIAH
jgi:hypothetical protein